VSLQIISGNYKVVSLEPVKRDSVRSRLAVLGLAPRQQEIASRVLQYGAVRATNAFLW